MQDPDFDRLLGFSGKREGGERQCGAERERSRTAGRSSKKLHLRPPKRVIVVAMLHRKTHAKRAPGRLGTGKPLSRGENSLRAVVFTVRGAQPHLLNNCAAHTVLTCN